MLHLATDEMSYAVSLTDPSKEIPLTVQLFMEMLAEAKDPQAQEFYTELCDYTG